MLGTGARLELDEQAEPMASLFDPFQLGSLTLPDGRRCASTLEPLAETYASRDAYR
jgi:hypothetical protein